MTEAEAYVRLRAMTATTADSHPDEVLNTYLLESLIPDAEGREPTDTDYVDTWDLHKAASLVWLDKAAALARTAFNLQTDMTKADRSGQINNAFAMSRKHRALSVATIIRNPDYAPAEDDSDNISVDA